MSFGQIKVLVAEDNHISQQLMRLLLTKFMNVEPVMVTNGIEAYKQVRTGNFDVVFMDNQMPECSGPESVELIRNDTSIEVQPYIIGLSASCPEEKKDFQKTGLDDYLEKPVSPKKLQHVLREFSGQEPFLKKAC